MDSLTLGANLIIKQLRLHDNLSHVRMALLNLINVDPQAPTSITGLVKTFRQHKPLVPALGSWISSSKNIPLTRTHVCLLLHPYRVEEFSKKLKINPDVAALALAKTIPLIIENEAKAGRLNKSFENEENKNANVTSLRQIGKKK